MSAEDCGIALRHPGFERPATLQSTDLRLYICGGWPTRWDRESFVFAIFAAAPVAYCWYSHMQHTGRKLAYKVQGHWGQRTRGSLTACDGQSRSRGHAVTAHAPRKNDNVQALFGLSARILSRWLGSSFGGVYARHSLPVSDAVIDRYSSHGLLVGEPDQRRGSYTLHVAIRCC